VFPNPHWPGPRLAQRVLHAPLFGCGKTTDKSIRPHRQYPLWSFDRLLPPPSLHQHREISRCIEDGPFHTLPQIGLVFLPRPMDKIIFFTPTKRSLPPALHVNPHHPQQTNHLFLLHLPPALPTLPLFSSSSLHQARGVPLAASKNKKYLHVFHNTRHNPQARFGTTQLYKNRQQVPQRALLRPVEQRGSPVLYQIRSHAGTCPGATRRHDRRRAHQPIGTIPRNHATLWPQPSSCLCTDRMQ
jgi:hypothetical protein